jgi:hypothetical protein
MYTAGLKLSLPLAAPAEVMLCDFKSLTVERNRAARLVSLEPRELNGEEP